MTTTVTKTVMASGGDYTSLSAWEAAQQGDLVAADEIRQAECHAFSDTTAVDIDGWTTDATHYIRVYAAQNHGGVYDVTSYRLEPNDTNWTLLCREEYARIEGLLLTNLATVLRVAYTFAASATSDQRWERCIIKGTANITNGMQWDNATTGRMVNCLVYDLTASSATAFYILVSSVVGLLNCTAINCKTGFSPQTVTILKNCAYYSQGLASANGYSGAVDAASTNNASDLASDSPGANPHDSVVPTFVNEANDDFHLSQMDQAWKGQGADLSATFTEDIDREDRRALWDIGADQAVFQPYRAPLPVQLAEVFGLC